MGREIEEAGTWYRGGILVCSLVCGAFTSMWLNSLDGWVTSTNSKAAGSSPAVEFVVPSTNGSGATAEVIGVEIDQRRMAYIRTAN